MEIKKQIIVKLIKLIIIGFIMLLEIVLMIHMLMKNILILIIMKQLTLSKNVMKDVGHALLVVILNITIVQLAEKIII